MARKTKTEQLWVCILLFFRLLIPIVLLISGIALFVSQVPAWGVVLGLPLIIIGAVLVIYTYDEVASIRIGSLPPKDIDEEVDY